LDGIDSVLLAAGSAAEGKKIPYKGAKLLFI
jgi:hypothetical protein